ncbi:unnamed protein product [Pieris macdunnoughi]|uniref:Uncharacterized protein n=1 Tax=Pieris macdunnoughi TaxID=345717 RepID=A0A821TBW6_9NEOP|nr:unnamed protein product [Pieris macdunnoughi]
MRNEKQDLFRQASPRDLEKLAFLERQERPYYMWWSQDCLARTFFHLPNKTLWNCFVCATTLTAVVLIAITREYEINIQAFFNAVYIIHVAALMCQVVRRLQYSYIDYCTAGKPFNLIIFKAAIKKRDLARRTESEWHFDIRNLRVSYLKT